MTQFIFDLDGPTSTFDTYSFVLVLVVNLALISLNTLLSISTQKYHCNRETWDVYGKHILDRALLRITEGIWLSWR